MPSTPSNPSKLTYSAGVTAVRASLLAGGGRLLILAVGGFVLVRAALVFFHIG